MSKEEEAKETPKEEVDECLGKLVADLTKNLEHLSALRKLVCTAIVVGVGIALIVISR